MNKETSLKNFGMNIPFHVDNSLELGKSLFVRCFEDEFSRLPVEEVMVLMPWLVQSCSTIKLHTLFSKENLVKLTEQTFTAPVIRDFCLCMADRFFIDLNGEENTQDNLISVLSNLAHITNGGSNLIPVRIISTLQTTSDKKQVIENLLKDNSWLVVIIMLFITYRLVLNSAIQIHPKLVPALKREQNSN